MNSLLLASIEPAVAIVGGILTIAGSVGGAVWAVARKCATVDEHVGSIADHEARLRTVERDVRETCTNVKWIKDALNKALHRGGDQR